MRLGAGDALWALLGSQMGILSLGGRLQVLGNLRVGRSKAIQEVLGCGLPRAGILLGVLASPRWCLIR